ncbi:MAG: hypothetical protein PHU06_09040 [Gallionella sp.]|nr:hypothetical protein [Gallionella sp.]MDD4959089.1 hypothetical protein [Gallionella sp.]
MGYADLIAQEANLLPVDKQAEVLDFIAFLKSRQVRRDMAKTITTPAEIAAFFRSFDVDTRGYKFDREAASAR